MSQQDPLQNIKNSLNIISQAIDKGLASGLFQSKDEALLVINSYRHIERAISTAQAVGSQPANVEKPEGNADSIVDTKIDE